MTTSGTRLDPALINLFLNGKISADALPEPNWGPIGREVYERTYSRQITDPDGTTRNETWAETVRRVVNGNLAYSPDTIENGEAARLFELIYTFKAVPAGRHLWVTGTDSQWTRNCFVSGWSPKLSDHFRFLGARLFEGGGVGANYSTDLLAATSPVVGHLTVAIACQPDHQDYEGVRASSDGLWLEPSDAVNLPMDSTLSTDTVVVVDDSREGWVDVWVRLIDLACTPGRHRIVIDVTPVRPHGAPLRTFGGRASGPAPLASSIVTITRILNRVLDQHPNGRPLTGLEAMDIDHEIAAAIVSGGSRRSARMAMMVWDDPHIFKFINCKADHHASHWSTNISVEIDERFHTALAAGDQHASEVLHAVAEGMARDGEPGLVDTSRASIGERTHLRATNPCGEVALETDPVDAAGEACNLGSVNLDAFGTDIDAAREAFRLMARFLYRATLNPYPDPAASRIEARNRRIGVGIMGLQGWCAAHNVRLSDLPASDHLRAALASFRITSREAANELADQLNLPRSIKVTAVAPTGTIAQLAGCTPGISPVHSRYFIRRVRYAETDPALIELAAHGYRIVDDIYAAHTKVVEFPVRDAILDRYPEHLIEQADEISFGQFMELVACVQTVFCGGSDGNAVSSTAHLPENANPEELVAAMRPVLGRVKGVTAFPAVSRPLAPIETLTRAEFEQLQTSGNVTAIAGDSNDGECVGGACPVR